MLNVIHLFYVVITWVIWLYSLFIVIDAILSWLPMLDNTVVGRFLDKVVNPYLNLFRRGPFAKLASSTGIDVSPIIGLFILYFVQNYVLFWLYSFLIKLVIS